MGRNLVDVKRRTVLQASSFLFPLSVFSYFQLGVVMTLSFADGSTCGVPRLPATRCSFLFGSTFCSLRFPPKLDACWPSATFSTDPFDVRIKDKLFFDFFETFFRRSLSAYPGSQFASRAHWNHYVLS